MAVPTHTVHNIFFWACSRISTYCLCSLAIFMSAESAEVTCCCSKSLIRVWLRELYRESRLRRLI